MLKKTLRIGGIGLATLLGFNGILALILYFSGFFSLPDLSRINDRKEMSIFYDERGEVIKEYCTYCREMATLEELGTLPKLAVAAEDHAFFERRFGALSFRAILRAFWHNLKTLDIQQGGSTITQQVARILFLGEELAREHENDSLSRSFWRKAREAWIATILDRDVTREKILEIYLNNIYCSEGRHGVKACARLFHKTPHDLDLAEQAMLIGMWRKPACSPFLNTECAKKLRSRVLEQLVHQGLVTETQKNEAEESALPQKREAGECHAQHFAAYVRSQIIEKRHLVDQGLRIHTTLNCDFQRIAVRELRASMEAMAARNPDLAKDLRGAALLVDAITGAIKVWVVEPSFSRSEFDLIRQARRHAGSAFKPFAYAAWIEKRNARLSAGDEGDGPWELDDSTDYDKDGKSLLEIPMGEGRDPHRIQNFPYEGEIPRYRGRIPAILALAESRNAATMSMVARVRHSGVKKEQRITKEEILEVAERLGIAKPEVDPGLTIAIGSINVSLFEMVRAWTGFLGTLVEPYAIEGVDDATGQELEEAAMQEGKKIFEEKTSRAILRGLRAAIEYIHEGKYVGTGKLAKKELDFQVMGKTGTATNKAGETKDNWFFGCTPVSYCGGILIGRDREFSMKSTPDPSDPVGKRMIQETGSKNCLPPFIALMKNLYRERPKEFFHEDTDPNKEFKYKKQEEKKKPLDTQEPVLTIEENLP